MSQGYIGDRTEEMLAFVKRGDGSVVYRSGDAGYRQTNGDIVFLYRIDSQVMVGGQRVELAEVEHALYGCDGVDQAVVRSCEGPEGASYLIAYMVLDEERALGAAEIRAQLSRNLAGFMVPEFFVRMPAIPLNVNGKPDTLKLPVVMKEGIL